MKVLDDAHNRAFAANGDIQVLRPQAANFYLPVTSHPFGTVVIPMDEAEQRCETARGQCRKLFACTEGRRAVAITRTTDRRDDRYLTGVSIEGGNAAYCGGIDAAIGRALIYAQWADVICYASSTYAFVEALQFATSIRTVFPEKLLGFAYRPRPNPADWGILEDWTASRMLHRLGYSYCLKSLATESQMMPQAPWMFVDDAA